MHITTGPDGALWFTESSAGQVGRITTDGAITEYPVTMVGNNPNDIVRGPDDALWFTDFSAAVIGRITTSGAVTKYPISGPAGGIAAGSDGAVWCYINNIRSPDKIARITPAGAVNEYPLPQLSLVGITSGPDGAIWFTLFKSVGRITTSGVIVQFPLGDFETTGGPIVAGPDGKVWFVIRLARGGLEHTGRITAAGVITEYPAENPGYPGGLGEFNTIGPDGAVWVVSPEISEFGLKESLTRMDVTGETTIYKLHSSFSDSDTTQFRDIATGPDGAFWLTDFRNRIGRVAIPSQPLKISALSLPLGQVGVSYSATATATGGTPPYSNWIISVELFTSPGFFAPGLTLDPSTGVISGIPIGVGNIVNGGTFSFEISVHDSTGARAIRQGSISINGSIPGIGFVGSMPHIAANENWTTAFTLVNKGTAPATAQLNLFGDPNGVLPLTLTLPAQPVDTFGMGRGAFLAGVLDRTLSANASLIVQTGGPQAPPVQVGSAQLSATGAIDGFAIFHHVLTQQETVVPMETRIASSYLLAFDNTGGSALGVAVANVSAQAVAVGVVIRDDTGAQIASGRFTLDGNGHTSFMLPTQYPVTANKRGTIEFDTPSAFSIVGILVFGQIRVLGMRFTPPNNAITTIPPLANVGTDGGSIAHIATGNGWQTTFVLVNTGTSAAPFQLNFFADNGNPLALPIGFPQFGSGTTSVVSFVNQTLPAGATLLVESAAPLSDPTPTIGSAQLTTSGNVGGFVIFRYTPNGQEGIVPFESRTASGYILAFDNTAGTGTGVAVNNASSQPANVPVVIRDDAGNLLTTDTLQLPPNGHSAFMLVTDRYPVTANIRGTIEFVTPPGGRIGALAGRFPGTHTFTTLPALVKQ